MSGTPPVALSLAGTDSGGAAGLAADLTTFAALGAHGACVVTAVTAQDTLGVRSVHRVPLSEVSAQLDAVLEDLPVGAAKTGMLGDPAVVELVAARLGRGGDRARPLVVDPVLVATSGAVLGDREVVAAYRRTLLPATTVLTPNADEGEVLLGRFLSPRDTAAALSDHGCTVLLTGGEPDGAACTDWWAVPGEPPVALGHALVATRNDHGTGCTHSAALAARLAHGATPFEAAVAAAAFTTARLRSGRDWVLGRGRGPVAHTHTPEEPS